MSDHRLSQVFDPKQELNIGEHSRPHWMQAGTITFITMRLADSIPRDVILRWDRERLTYLNALGIECDDWRRGCDKLSTEDRARFQKHFRRLREESLDTSLGKCWLRHPEAAKIVADSLLHFDNDRYSMGDFVVMPNHVHLLAVFPDGESMRRQCYSWTKFTATQINRMNGTTGPFWQEEPFDHLVRSEPQLNYLRNYIANNPTKANLRDEEYLYRKSNRLF